MVIRLHLRRPSMIRNIKRLNSYVMTGATATLGQMSSSLLRFVLETLNVWTLTTARTQQTVISSSSAFLCNRSSAVFGVVRECLKELPGIDVVFLCRFRLRLPMASLVAVSNALFCAICRHRLGQENNSSKRTMVKESCKGLREKCIKGKCHRCEAGQRNVVASVSHRMFVSGSDVC